MQGHIHKRVHTCKNGRTTTHWNVVVDVARSADGRRRRQKWHGGFRTRREVEVVRARLVSNMHAGTYVMPDRLTLGQWVSGVWLPLTAARVKPTTLHSYVRNLELHVPVKLPTRSARCLRAAMRRDHRAFAAGDRCRAHPTLRGWRNAFDPERHSAQT